MTLETRQGDEWISSDAQILRRMVQVPVKEGMQCTLAMPIGEPLVAILEKMNVGGANAFCQLVRGTYSERRTGQEAASAKRHAELAEQRERLTKQQLRQSYRFLKRAFKSTSWTQKQLLLAVLYSQAISQHYNQSSTSSTSSQES